MKIGFIGGGNMARAMIGGLKQHAFEMHNITVLESDAQKRADLTLDFNVQVTDTYAGIAHADVLVLAVKPQQLKVVCDTLNPILQNQLIVSIAAGIRSEDIIRWLNDYQSVVRVMPNTPAQIQAGISVMYASQGVTQLQREQSTQILSAVGKVLWIAEESKMDAVTAISGSGPAYVFYLIEALQEAGIKLGLTAEEACLLALETFSGASQLAVLSQDSVQQLRAQVTSKGGTTEQGILALQAANVKEVICNATLAAANQSKVLGDQLGKQ
ncbi:MAG: pyrroline-5-carboxylate reductase [Methylotenera sp.]|nr:pyrroline-5-carboxylate reductase [Methylotenera sp.]